MSTTEQDLNQRAIEKATRDAALQNSVPKSLVPASPVQQSQGPRGGGGKPSTSPMPGGPKGGGGAPTPAKGTPPKSDILNPSAIQKGAMDVAQGLRDAPGAIVRGAGGAVDSLLATTGSMEDWIDKNVVSMPYLDLRPGKDWIGWHRKEEDKTKLEPILPEKSESATGQAIEGISKFVTGVALTRRIFPLPSGKIVEPLASGAITDFIQANIEPNEKNLSNIINENPWLANPVSDFMSNKIDDGEFTRRVKAAAAGSILNLGMEGFLGSVRWVKTSKLLVDPATKPAEATLLRSQLEEQLNKVINESDKAVWKVVKDEETGISKVVGKGPDGVIEHPLTFKTESEAASEAAALNLKENNYTNRLTDFEHLTPEQIDEAKVFWDELNADPKSALAKVGIHFNFDTFPGTPQVHRLLNALSKVAGEQFDAARGGSYLSNEALRQRVADLNPNWDADEILRNLGELYSNTKDMEAHVMAGYTLMSSQGKKVSQLSAMWDGDPTNMLLAQEVSKEMDILFQAGLWTKGMTTRTARTLQAMNGDNLGKLAAMAEDSGAAKTVGGVLKDTLGGEEGVISAKIKASLPTMPVDDIRLLARRLRMAGGDPSALQATATAIAHAEAGQVLDTSFWSKLNQMQVGMMLSGVDTTVANITGTASNVLVTPLTKWVSGALQGDSSVRQEAIDIFTGYFTQFPEAVRAGLTALKTGKSVMDAPFGTMEYKGPIQGYLGQALNASGRLLMAQDDFFKSLGYRSFVRAEAMKEAREMGLNGSFVKKYADDAIKAAYSETKGATNEAGLKYARQTTFTEPLKKWSEADNPIEGIGHAIAKASSDMPWFRYMVAPFVRTPTRIYEFTYNYTPLLSALQASTRETLRAGGPEAADIYAKWAVGSVVWGTGAGLYATGRITGKGPTDPGLREDWLLHNRPYSIRLWDDTWIGYNRADPLFTPFGLVADFGDILSENQKHAEGIPAAVVAAISRSITSKTYLFAMTDFMDALNSGDGNRVQSYIQRKVSGTLTPSLTAKLNPDPYQREVRGVIDQLMSRTPGFSDLLPAKRNFMGEPTMKLPGSGAIERGINPFSVYHSKNGNEAMDTELFELGKSVSMPDKFAPGTKVDMTSRDFGLHGTQTPYDRMLDLIASPAERDKESWATVRGASQPLREQLRDMMSGDMWKGLTKGVAEYEPGGSKLMAVNLLVGENRAAALKQVKKEFPKLFDAIRTDNVTRLGSKTVNSKEELEKSTIFQFNMPKGNK